MVHGLETIKRLNEVKQGKEKTDGKKTKVPAAIANNPLSVRRFFNRPWRASEVAPENREEFKAKGWIEEPRK